LTSSPPQRASRQVRLPLPPIVLVLGAGFVLRLLVAYVLFPGEGLKGDLDLLGPWAQTLADYGPSGFYTHAGFADYAPGYLWILWVVGLLGNGIAGLTGQASADIIAAIIKLPAIFADLAIAWLLYRAASAWHDRRAGLAAAALYLFIPVTWYDSALWGQVDAVGALLLLGAVLLLIEGWSEPAVALAVFATVTKPQYGIGLVIVGAVLLRRHLLKRGSGPVPALGERLSAIDRRFGGLFTTRQGFVRLVSCAAVGVVVGLAAILPFDLPTQAPVELQDVPLLGHISGLMAMFAASAGYFQVLTANAFNMWALVGPTPLSQAFGANYQWTYDSLAVVGGIQAVTIGATLLGATALAVIAALLVRDDRRTIIMGLTVLAVAFYVLPTRVHERYMLPAFAVGALLAVTSIGWRWWYVLLGIANAANLHAILTFDHRNYATPGLIGLPLADFTRDELTIAVLAITQTVLFAILFVALVRHVPWPVQRVMALTRLRGGRPQTSAPPTVTTVPIRREPPADAAAARPTDDRAPGVGAPATVAAVARVGAMVIGAARFVLDPIRDRLDSGPAPEDGSAAIAVEGRGRIDRRDVAIALILVAIAFGMRTFRLGTPPSMYFDESFYPRTGMEFLQDWRYGMPHDLWETTHPPLSKYIIAEGISLFGDNRVTSTSDAGSPVRDVAFEPAFASPSGPNGLGGDRIALATGDGVRIAPHGDLSAAKLVAIPGASTVAFDASADRLFVGTQAGGLWLLDGTALAVADTDRTVPAPVKVLDLGSEVGHLWSAGDGQIAASTQDGRLTIVSSRFGSILASASVPGITALVPLDLANRSLAVLALPTGLREVDTSTLNSVADIPLAAAPTGAVLVDGSDFLRRNREMLSVPTLYVAMGSAGIQTLTMGPDGALVMSSAFAMPGPITTLQWDRPSNIVHALGTAPDGEPTIYAVMPFGNVVFADAKLPFKPVAWVLDVQPNAPQVDRQRALAFSGSGQVAMADVGSNAFAWRILGVIAGALMAGLLYLLARLLFRRRTVGYLLAIILALDGLLFSQSRIAMNDTYLGLFIVAAFTLLAYLLQGGWSGRRARLATALGLPLVGILLGLALGTKWVGAYAMGGAVLIVLFRSPVGRRIALGGMVLLTAILGWQALAEDPANYVFPAIMVGLTLLLGAAIVQIERDPGGGAAVPDGPSWIDPRRRWGIPFGWAMACLTIVPLVVYVVIYIPWALSAGGSPQLFSGWPPGHIGQTFADLQVQMYRYHNELRTPHGASSPWWAWPFDLKPIWGYWETFVDSTEATVLGAGNPILLWLSVPAVAFGAWQAWRRRSAALLFILVAFLALWLPWARIDRVAFNYHYYTALPFAFLLLAYFLAELWGGPSRRTWNLARVAFAVVLIAPALLWIYRDPLCGVSGVAAMNSGAFACTRPLSDVALPVLGWFVAALVAGWFILGARRPRRLVVAILVAAGIMFAALYPALSAMRLPAGWVGVYQGLLPSWDVSFLFGSNTAPVSVVPLLGFGPLVLLVLVGGAVWWVMNRGAASWPSALRLWGRLPRLAGPAVAASRPNRLDVRPASRAVATVTEAPVSGGRALSAMLAAAVARLRGLAARSPSANRATNTARRQPASWLTGRRALVLGGIGAWLLLVTAGPVQRVFDADEYWNLATYWVDGVAHAELFRGYSSGLLFVPAVLVSRWTSIDPELVILGEMSAILAVLGWVILPSFQGRALGRSATLPDRIVSTVLLWFLWGGFASAALLDLPALFMFLLAVLISWRGGRWWVPLAAGLVAGLAYNMRPAYLAGAVGIVVVVALAGNPDWRIRLRHSVLVALGILVALAPQSLMNVSAGAPALPPTPALTGEFLAFHLGSGVVYQRYETALDPNWPSPQVWSCDPGGIQLVAASGSPPPSDLVSYASLMLSNPIAGAELLARRVGILLWLNERGPYVTDVAVRNPAYGVVNVLLVGLFAAFVLARARRSPRLIVGVILILLACGPALISLADLRFFVPLSVAGIAFCVPAISWLRHATGRVRLAVATACVLLLLASGVAAAQATANQVPGVWPASGGPACPAQQ